MQVIEGDLNNTAVVSLIKSAMPTVEVVLQDRFHVHHAVSPSFNNQDPRYFSEVILGWRDATVYRDPEKERILDGLLKAGKIAKKTTFQHQQIIIHQGDIISDAQIAEWKQSGAYHAMFSSHPAVLVPEHVKDEAVLRCDVPEWAEGIIARCFDSDGRPITIRMAGGNRNSKLVSSADVVRQIGDNALLRILHCVPPAHLREFAWRDTGKTQNGMVVWAPCFHSGGSESWNSTQPDFVVGDHSSQRLATALMLEGDVCQNSRSNRRLGLEEDTGHFQPARCLELNKWSGHGPEAEELGMHQLVARPPRELLVEPTHTGETIIHGIGAFNAGATKRRLAAQPERVQCATGPVPQAGLPPPSVAEQLQGTSTPAKRPKVAQPQLPEPTSTAAPPPALYLPDARPHLKGPFGKDGPPKLPTRDGKNAEKTNKWL